MKITCRAVGIPIPLINWRKNGHHIPGPPKVTTTTVNGHGTLIIHDAVATDHGSYSCEAINSRDSVFAQNDALLVVKRKQHFCFFSSHVIYECVLAINLLCQSSVFNDLATDVSQCLRCFCFGVSDTCYSSSVQPITISLADNNLTVAAVGQQANGTYQDLSHLYPPIQTAIKYEPIMGVHSINSEVSALHTPDTIHFYWRLPKKFLGNQLMSYGSFLKYSIRYQETFSPSPLKIPDVIIHGNGITLYHYEKDFFHNLNGETNVEVRFWVGEWHRDDQYSEIPPLFEDTTREDIMIVLQNIENILIKASYDANMLESSILNIEMESAQISNDSDLSRSAYVEQCSCPEGYTGSSCERCSPGYILQPMGRYLGRCNLAPPSCQCNGHSEECDPFTGHCINCRDHTEGINCERCERGYYSHPENNDKLKCIKCPCGQNSGEQLKS